MGETGYVYVAKHETKPATFKIGRTSDIRQRDNALQGGAPGRPIKIVEYALVDDMHAVEKALHAMLRQALLPNEREWFNIELDQVTPMLALMRRWCATSPTATQPRIQRRSEPSATPTDARNRRGWWHEDGWKMHCEGAAQAAIAKEFDVTGPTVGWMIDKMRKAGRGHEERNRSRPKRGRKKASVPGRIPQWAFRQPIVDVLRALGGRGPVKEVLRLLERKMDFSEADRKKLKNGAIAWENRAQWERAQMKQDGVLKPDSERGWWELA